MASEIWSKILTPPCFGRCISGTDNCKYSPASLCPIFEECTIATTNYLIAKYKRGEPIQFPIAQPSTLR